MALIKCIECGKQVSDKATTCPHCGAPIELSLNTHTANNANYKSNHYTQKTASKKAPWHKRPGWIIALLILFFPVGLFLVWKSDWKKSIKVIATICVLYYVFVGIGGGSSPEQDDSSYPETTIQAEETTESESSIPETLSAHDQFVADFCVLNACKVETAEKVYSLLTDHMGYTEITSVSLSDIGNINYDIVADNYEIMLAVDDDDIYRGQCGDYVIYEDGEVKYTKQDLDDRSLNGNESDYYAIAKYIVSENLKAPSTADFCSISDCVMQKNKEYVAVQGYVDASNSFGAMLRNEFLVEFRVIDLDSFRYETVYVALGDESSGEFVSLD